MPTYEAAKEMAIGEVLGRGRPSLEEKLLRTKAEFEHELDKINKALDMLKKYPEMAEFTNLISKLSI